MNKELLTSITLLVVSAMLVFGFVKLRTENSELYETIDNLTERTYELETNINTLRNAPTPEPEGMDFIKFTLSDHEETLVHIDGYLAEWTPEVNEDIDYMFSTLDTLVDLFCWSESGYAEGMNDPVYVDCYDAVWSNP